MEVFRPKLVAGVLRKDLFLRHPLRASVVRTVSHLRLIYHWDLRVEDIPYQILHPPPLRSEALCPVFLLRL